MSSYDEVLTVIVLRGFDPTPAPVNGDVTFVANDPASTTTDGGGLFMPTRQALSRIHSITYRKQRKRRLAKAEAAISQWRRSYGSP